MKYLFIYPNEEQLEEINKIKYNKIIINKNKVFEIDLKEINLDYKNYIIFCCNEEALYFSKTFLNNEINSSYNKKCLELYDKIYCDELYNSFDISHIKKNEVANIYPLVAKPNFGFASIGVKIINNEKEKESYLKSFDEMIINSQINELKKKYFENIIIQPVYEKKRSNVYFYSVPFVYDKNKNKVIIFPVKGVKTKQNIQTDYYWKEFVYDESRMNTSIYNMIEELLLNVSRKLLSKSSVNMAEVFYNIESDNVELIEFSPRVPGGKISKLIEYGSGVNLNRLSIEVLVKKEVCVNKKRIPVKLTISFDESDVIEDVIEIETIYSDIFNQNIKYVISEYKYPKIGLIPGRFAPPHKGHQLMFDKALKEMDKVIVLIYDTNDINVPLDVRAKWIKTLYPTFYIIEGNNCPDGDKYAYENGQECAFYQNKYIIYKTKKFNITHVYHGTTYGESVSKALDSIENVVDLSRKKISISGTIIRKDPLSNKKFLDEYVFEEYKKYLNVLTKDK